MSQVSWQGSAPLFQMPSQMPYKTSIMYQLQWTDFKACGQTVGPFQSDAPSSNKSFKIKPIRVSSKRHPAPGTPTVEGEKHGIVQGVRFRAGATFGSELRFALHRKGNTGSRREANGGPSAGGGGGLRRPSGESLWRTLCTIYCLIFLKQTDATSFRGSGHALYL